MTNTTIESSNGSKLLLPPKDSKDKVVKRKPRQQSEIWEHLQKMRMTILSLELYVTIVAKIMQVILKEMGQVHFGTI